MILRLAGRAADVRTATRPRTRSRARTQTIARGPVALMIAIKQLGTNGGGFYNSNSAVPFENPNGLTNFLEMLSILLIPAAQVFMFGRMVLARRHAWMVFAAMFVVFVVGIAIALPAEQHGSQVLRASGVNITQGHGQSGGNMADKEVRFGIANTALWATATTDASNGSVNGGHDALTPAGGAVPLVNIFLGEVIFGGVGSGLYGMFFYIVIAVFIAGLMVGRTPEYLGKKIEAREIKFAAVGALFVPTMVLDPDRGLGGDASPGSRRSSTPARTASPRRSTPTRRSRTTTAARSPATARRASRAYFGSVAMLLGRFVPLLAALAIGGSLAAQEDRAGLGGHVPHRRADVRRAARRRDRADRRPDGLPGADARPDRRRADRTDAARPEVGR